MSNGEFEEWRNHGGPIERMAPSPSVTSGGAVDLDVSWLVPADLYAVDALARLQVAVSRRGRWLLLHGADGGLVELFNFVGLGDVVHLCACCRGACDTPDQGDADVDRGAEPPA
jgi:hypothetical protein